MTKKRWLILAVVSVGAVLLTAAGLLTWHARPRTQTFFTDADTIRQPAKGTQPRDILWQPPTPLSELVNTGGEDYEPRLSWDGLALFYVRGRAGENADVHVSHRTVEGWTEAEPLVAVNSEHDDLGPEPSKDGQTLVFYSNRPGGAGGYDLWASHNVDGQWQPPTNLGSAVNSEYNDYGPALSPDGTLLLFASNRPRPDDGKQPDPDAWPATVREDLFQRTYDLYAATRGERGLSPARPLGELNTPFNEGAPCISPAGDFVYFSSDRPGGRGGFDLYRSWIVRGEYRLPTNLAAPINTAANELDPGIGGLGYALYFSSDQPAQRLRPDKPNDYNLYYAAAREVFTEVESRPAPPIDWAALWRQVLPNLLWAVLALLLLVVLMAFVGDLRRGRLSLLARCLLASLMAHLLVMMLLNFWQVTATVADAVRGRGEIQVALTPAGAADEITAQIRGGLAGLTPPESAAPPAVQQLAQIEQPEITPAVLEVDRAADMPVEASPLEAAAREAREPEPSKPAPPTAGDPTTDALALRPALPDATAPIDTPEREVDPTPRQTTSRQRHAALASTSMPPVALVAEVPLVREIARQVTEAAGSLTSAVHASEAVPRAAAPSPVAGSNMRVPEVSRLPLSVPADARQDSPAVETSAVPPAATLASGPRRATLAPSTSGVTSPTARFEPDAAAPIIDSDGPTIVDVAAPDADPRVAPVLPRMTSVVLQPTIAERAPMLAGDLMLPSTADAPDAGSSETEARVAAPRTAIMRVSWPVRSASTDARTTSATAIQPAALAADDVPQPSLAPGPSAVRLHVPGARSTAPPDVRLAAAVEATRLPVELPSVELEVADSPTAQPVDPHRPGLAGRDAGPETASAIAGALAWLAANQSPAGNWTGLNAPDADQPWTGQTEYDLDAGLTGLALLCFLGAGHTHTGDGPHRDSTARAIDWLLLHQDDNGDLRDGETMYSHAMATIALAEALVLTDDRRLEEPLRRAVGFIVAAQNPETGGWQYDPGDVGDTSVVGWQVMALRRANLAGVPVPTDTFVLAQQWLAAAESPSEPGRYSYQPGDPTAASMTAEAMLVQQMLGVPRDNESLRASLAHLLESEPSWSEDALDTYLWYFATLARFHYGGEQWAPWRDALRPVLLVHQEKTGPATGSWPPEGKWADIGGRVYQTAICTLTLEVGRRYLPLRLPDGQMNIAGTLQGAVAHARTGQPLAGVTVKVDLAGGAPATATTGPDGLYSLHVPQTPDYFAITAACPDFIPQSKSVSGRALRRRALTIDFRLELEDEATVAIEDQPRVHHLGNDRFEGRINSQFQRDSEGRGYRAEFELSPRQASATRVVLTLLAKGVQCPHPIRINGELLVQRLDRAPADGSFGEFRTEIDPALLQPGTNLLDIRSSSCRGDLDDFEFVNVQIELTP